MQVDQLHIFQNPKIYSIAREFIVAQSEMCQIGEQTYLSWN